MRPSSELMLVMALFAFGVWVGGRFDGTPWWTSAALGAALGLVSFLVHHVDAQSARIDDLERRLGAAGLYDAEDEAEDIEDAD